MASFHDLAATSSVFFSLLIISLLSGELAPVQRVLAQQPYGKEIADCPNQHNTSGLLGYHCNTPTSSPPSCRSFLTFTARPPYTTLASIAALLNADTTTLAAANSAVSIAAGTRVLIPTTCTCTSTPDGSFYQRNASSYVAKPGDTLLIIANDTFQGLTSCQALQAQALPRGAKPESLDAGQTLPAVPLLCACPSASQAAAGARFLVTYLVDWFDEVNAVAARFGVDADAIIAANELQPPYTIYPFTTLLIPVSAQPNVSRIQTPPAPPPSPTTVARSPPAPGNKGGNHAGVYIGVAVAVVAVVAIASAGVALVLRRRRAAGAVLAAGELAKKGGSGKKGGDTGTTPSAFTGSGGGEFSSWPSTSEAFSSISLTDIKSSLKVYTYGELVAATENFSAAHHIGGSVYRASFGGDTAAVEVVDDRSVAAEVEIMMRTSHLNLIRLIGLCHHAGRWFLVTEFADHGSLRHRLLLSSGGGAAGAPPPPALTWAQRVAVALDVAEGLRYLHEHARPACVHMDISTGAVLLAGDNPPRAKLRISAAARAITGATAGVSEEEAAFTMTSRIAGTRGYLAPEYLEHGVVSAKADVYSLGVVMLELVTGKGAEELVGDGVGDPFVSLRELAEELDGEGEGVTQRLEELVDPTLPAGSCPLDGVVVMVRLIERCVRRDAASRPSTGEVARRLLKLSGVAAVGWRNSPEESPRSSGSGKGLMY